MDIIAILLVNFKKKSCQYAQKLARDHVSFIGFGLINLAAPLSLIENRIKIMKRTSKSILVVVVCLLGIGGAFVGGAYWATLAANKMDKENFCSQVIVQAKVRHLALEHIDKNEIAKGHQFLMSQLSGDIMFLDDIREQDEDKVIKERIENLLQQIARHRDEFPEYCKISDSQSPETKESIAIVNKILQKYKM